jgi:hypothetical protein
MTEQLRGPGLALLQSKWRMLVISVDFGEGESVTIRLVLCECGCGRWGADKRVEFNHPEDYRYERMG